MAFKLSVPGLVPPQIDGPVSCGQSVAAASLAHGQSEQVNRKKCMTLWIAISCNWDLHWASFCDFFSCKVAIENEEEELQTISASTTQSPNRCGWESLALPPPVCEVSDGGRGMNRVHGLCGHRTSIWDRIQMQMPARCRPQGAWMAAWAFRKLSASVICREPQHNSRRS